MLIYYCCLIAGTIAKLSKAYLMKGQSLLNKLVFGIICSLFYNVNNSFNGKRNGMNMPFLNSLCIQDINLRGLPFFITCFNHHPMNFINKRLNPIL